MIIPDTLESSTFPVSTGTQTGDQRQAAEYGTERCDPSGNTAVSPHTHS